MKLYLDNFILRRPFILWIISFSDDLSSFGEFLFSDDLSSFG